MILTTLNECMRYEHLHPSLGTLFNYIKAHGTLLHEPLGKIEIEGDALFVNNSIVDAVARDKQLLELHRQYIDVHILLQGHETVGWKPLAEIEHVSKPYDDATDAEFSNDTPSAYIDMLPGHMLIVFPEDAHAPIIGEGKIRKLIGKVRIF